jgi:hypothetical protein
VYSKDLGWVPFDPLHVAQGGASFERMKPAYIYLSRVRNGAVLGGHHYYSFAYRRDAVTVEDTFSIHQQQGARSR